MSTPATDSSASRQVLTFSLGEESYGIDILQVQEIRGWAPVTHIPQSPPHVLGVLNLRARSCRSWTCASDSPSRRISRR